MAREEAFEAAKALTDYFIRKDGGEWMDGWTVMKVAMAGYLAGSGVPTDQAVHAVELMTVKGLTGPASRNPLYQGLPWYVSGPVSGVPYYADH